MFEAKHKKKKDKKNSKTKKKQQCLFKKSASKTRGGRLSVEAEDDPEISLYIRKRKAHGK